MVLSAALLSSSAAESFFQDDIAYLAEEPAYLYATPRAAEVSLPALGVLYFFRASLNRRADARLEK
jgi:hypothetical protein